VGNLHRVFQERLAAAGGKLALTDFLAMTREIGLLGDGSPHVLLPFLTRAATAPDAQLSPDARTAAAYLRAWDLKSADWSVAPTLYGQWVAELKQLLFPMKTDNRDEQAIWNQFIDATTLLHALQGPRSSVPQSRSRLEGREASQVVLEALENAVAKMRTGRPQSMNFWGMRQSWIDLRPLPPLPYYRRGTYLFAAEMTPQPLIYSVAIPGNSGDPQSIHFSDQRDLGGWFLFKMLACTRSQLESGK
jgi:acyl-homoserine lactone acylase PvdQ